MTTVLVTGATGRAGQFIVNDLLENGYEVVGVDQNSPNDTRQHRVTGYTFKFVDVTDFGQVVSAMKNCDAVIHMAAITNPRIAVSYTHLRAHETREDLVCPLVL